MESILTLIRIEVPASVVYDYLTAPANLMEIWPSLLEVANVTTSEDGAHEFDWTYKMAGVRFRGHTRTISIERHRSRLVQNEGIPSLFRWSFDERAGLTEVALAIEYELPPALLAKLAKPFLRRLNEREAHLLLANLKERLELTLRPLISAEASSASPPP
jgi:hypothetical protein